MSWQTVHDRAITIGVVLVWIALGALADGIIIQSGKVNFWKERSNELYNIQPASPTLSRAAVPQVPPKCRDTSGYRGEPVRHQS